MRDRLDILAESYGISVRYVSELGEPTEISNEAKRALLHAIQVDPDASEPGDSLAEGGEATRRCRVPEELAERRAWGLSCQLYGLRSKRNLGIGDFSDLVRLGEIAAAAGAAFLGVNPLHALFLADPGRYSPYSPSTRRFLNPLYIAVDAVPGGEAALAALRREDAALFEDLDGDLVDYGAVGRLKARLLRTLFDEVADGILHEAAFQAFRTRSGSALRDFSLFEAISAHMAARGESPGWHNWPDGFHERHGETVRRFWAEHQADILFHEWLQFVAEGQLAGAQENLRRAGMRIGLYLDFAVGVSPDGAETWADPDLTVREARVGSPPDMFNSAGQDWGLAPLSPRALAERHYAPLASAYDAMMRHAGAVRIDHALGLARLWWIPEAGTSVGGGYMRYPLGAMIDTVAAASAANDCVVIGEDLGTVPDGFRPAMEKAGILSYRVLYFERAKTGAFIAPQDYPALSLACISTHDLATLSGWWTGADVRLRAETGRQTLAATERDSADRDRDRRALLVALAAAGLIPQGQAEALLGDGHLPPALIGDLTVAIHRFGARTRSMMFAVQLEDMVLSARQANLPGTTDEYPNWRIRSEVFLEDLEGQPLFQTIARAMREERPETP